MDKKDIYEHLAKIYLDASSKKKKKNKAYPQLFRNLFFISLMFVFGLSGVLLNNSRNKEASNSQIELVLAADPLKINFNFDPAKKEIYSLNLNRLNLNRYGSVAFSVKKANFRDTISLRVEFTSAFKEKSEVYLKNIPHAWKEYNLNLADFKGISDWSEILTLAFIVEDWNTKENNGVVYIDNVRLLK
jgi:hypothetical protein